MKHVKVCPKCSGKVNVYHPNIFSKMGMLPMVYKCEKCGYEGKYVIEVPIDKLEEHKKLLERNKKKTRKK